MGGRIIELGGLGAVSACRVIDASNRIVAPGLIDVHTPDDGALLAIPRWT